MTNWCRVLIVATTIAASVAFVGCGSNAAPSSSAGADTASSAQGPSVAATESSSEPNGSAEAAQQDLKVTESGFFNNEFDSVDFAFTIENPNKTWYAQDLALNVTGKDESGKVVFTTTEYAPYIMPGQTLKIADTSAGQIETLEVTPNLHISNWKQDEGTGDASSYDALFAVSNLAEIPDQYGTGSVTYTGEVANGLGDSVSGISVSIILRDASGAIVAGYRGHADPLPSGSTPFQVDTLAAAPEHTSYEVYAYPAY